MEGPMTDVVSVVLMIVICGTLVLALSADVVALIVWVRGRWR
jgi:hypothetical protein